MNGQSSSLDEFWPFYLSQHLHPMNRRLHFLGTSTGLFLLAAAAVRREPRLVLAAVLAGYFLAWLGHYGFEKNRPATFASPWLSFRADLRMYRLALTNQLDAEFLLRMKDIRRYARG